MLKLLICASMAVMLIGCGSSSDSNGGPGGAGGPGIACDDPKPRMTHSPSFDPATIPAGQTTKVALTVPVTQSAYRVMIDIAQIDEPISKSLGMADQAYNDGTLCSVVVPVDFFHDIPAGKYFPTVTIQPKGDAGESFVSYGWASHISKTNYRLTTEIGNAHDSQIPIPFITIE